LLTDTAGLVGLNSAAVQANNLYRLDKMENATENISQSSLLADIQAVLTAMATLC
jgi:hypothetical protein